MLQFRWRQRRTAHIDSSPCSESIFLSLGGNQEVTQDEKSRLPQVFMFSIIIRHPEELLGKPLFIPFFSAHKLHDYNKSIQLVLKGVKVVLQLSIKGELT